MIAHVPPAGPLLIDTNVVKRLLRGDVDRGDGPFQDLVEGHLLVLAFATVGEIYAGYVKAGWSPERWERLEEQLETFDIIPGDAAVTRAYGRLAAKLGTSTQKNDLWIAACALSETVPLPIVTLDTDFDRIQDEFPELTVVHPATIEA